MNIRQQLGTVAAVVAALASPWANAHGVHESAGGFGAGLAHPFMGLDHVLAMLTVGLWAAQTGGRALWAVPATFVATMAAGSALALAGFALPHVEIVVALSVVTLGLLVAFAVRMPLPVGVALTGAFALFHGYAHGSELPALASPVTYAVGFLLATALLHLSGVASGLALDRVHIRRLRLAGACVSAAGVMLVTSL
jgi:urease accessory protein